MSPRLLVKATADTLQERGVPARVLAFYFLDATQNFFAFQCHCGWISEPRYQFEIASSLDCQYCAEMTAATKRYDDYLRRLAGEGR